MEQRPVVSDPLPSSANTNLNAYFDDFEIPPPANTDPIDTTLWDLEFFNAINFADALNVPDQFCKQFRYKLEYIF